MPSVPAPSSAHAVAAPASAQAMKEALQKAALEAGFDVARVLAADSVKPARHLHAGWLSHYVAEGLHGDMGWMAETLERRADPRSLWPKVRSIVLLGMNYGPATDPLEQLKASSHGAISVYAQGGDYHQLIKKRLKRVASWLARTTGEEVKVFVDTAPVLEKPLAQRAGLGWQGKHSNLVSRSFGAWLFLGEIFTTASLPADPPERDHCGRCQRCLDICPTDAFVAPYRLDPRRCISYLTIEHKGHIPRALRPLMGNRIFGCDDCLAVCPWNKFARRAREARFMPRDGACLPPLSELLALDEAAFRDRFKGSAIKRPGRNRFLRNVLIAAGNSADPRLLPHIEPLLDDPAPLVRAMAVWALSQLMDTKTFTALKARHLPKEPDAAVRREWDFS